MKPIIQLSIDTSDMNRALKIVEDTINHGIEWVEIGTPLLKNYGLNVIRTFKDKFPQKKLVVPLSTIFTDEDINDAVDAGADIILIPEISDMNYLKKHVEAGKKRGVEIMAHIDWLSPFEERSKLLSDLGIDYILINLPDDRILYTTELIERIRRVSDSLDKPVGVGRNINPDNIRDALRSGAQILVISKAITEVEDSREAAIAIREILDNGEIETEIIDEAVDFIDTADEKELYSDLDEYIDFRFIESDLEKLRKKVKEFGKRRESELEKLKSMEDRIKELEEFEKECTNLRDELINIEKIRTAEKEELEEEKEVLKEDIKKLEELRELENLKIEAERKKIDEEFGKLGLEWKKLKDAEIAWNERQKIKEEESKKRLEKIWSEWEEQQRKRFKEYTLEKEEEKKRTDDEMQKVEKRWDELDNIVKRIGDEKEKLSTDREKIKEEWSKIENQMSTLKEEQDRLRKLSSDLEKNKAEVMTELENKVDKSITYLPKLVSRVSDIYKEREQELRSIRSQRRIIDEKIKQINNKLLEIEKLEKEKEKDKKLIEEDREKIKDELSKIEKDLHQLKKEHSVDTGKKAVEKLKKEEAENKSDLAVKPMIRPLEKPPKEPLDKKIEEPIERPPVKPPKRPLKKPLQKEKNLSEEDLKKKELISSLINLVSKKGEVDLKDAAEILNVDEKVVERWGKILEEKNIIIVDKKLFGNTILKEGIDMHKLT